MSILPQPTYEQFVAFTLLCITGSDFDIDSDELSEIESILNRISPNDRPSSETIPEITALLKTLDDAGKKEFIATHIPIFLTTEELRAQFKEDMEEVIVADLSVEASELGMFNFVKRKHK